MDAGDYRDDRGCLPSRLRMLCVGVLEPSWVSLTLKLDAAGCFEPSFLWANSTNDAVSALRSEVFDCVIVALEANESSESVARLLHAIQSAEHDEPIVVIAPHLEDACWNRLAAFNCEILVTSQMWESQSLVPMIRRARSRNELALEIRRLNMADQRRLGRERDEAAQLLEQQRQMIESLSTTATTVKPPSDSKRPELPPEINRYYHDLLRTHVIMGSGSLESEIEALADVFAVANISPRESLEIHVKGLESLIQGLGNRSARHVMSRADLLVLDLLIHLGESYRQRAEQVD